MNKCPKEKNLWNELSYMIMGISLFEVTSKLITHLESKGDYGSPIYLILLTLTTIGLMIAINYVLSIYIQIKKSYSIFPPNPQEKLDLSLFRDIFNLLKAIIKNVKQSLTSSHNKG